MSGVIDVMLEMIFRVRSSKVDTLVDLTEDGGNSLLPRVCYCTTLCWILINMHFVVPLPLLVVGFLSRFADYIVHTRVVTLIVIATSQLHHGITLWRFGIKNGVTIC